MGRLSLKIYKFDLATIIFDQMKAKRREMHVKSRIRLLQSNFQLYCLYYIILEF